MFDTFEIVGGSSPMAEGIGKTIIGNLNDTVRTAQMGATNASLPDMSGAAVLHK